MDFKGLQLKAKQMIARRGGTDSVKADAKELKDISKGPGTIGEKAKRAGDALKNPGAQAPVAPSAPPPPADVPDAAEPGSPSRR